MGYEYIEVRKISPHVGAEILGVDLTRPMADAQFSELRRALWDNLVIFFRDQHLTPEQHMDFARRFGTLRVHATAPSLLPGHPEILMVKTDERSNHATGEAWHTDESYEPEPPMGSILHILDVPPIGGDTMFASMYRAYETLSEPLKKMLDTMTALHDSAHVHQAHSGSSKNFPQAVHPVVITHPESGRRALYVNSRFTLRILELQTHESEALLQMLYRHVERPEHQCRFHWEPDSVAFWDNRCTQHKAIWDYYPHRRYGQRITIKGVALQ